MWFKLAAPGLELQLGLDDLNKVRIHEEITSKLLDSYALVFDDGSMRIFCGAGPVGVVSVPSVT